MENEEVYYPISADNNVETIPAYLIIAREINEGPYQELVVSALDGTVLESHNRTIESGYNFLEADLFEPSLAPELDYFFPVASAKVESTNGETNLSADGTIGTGLLNQTVSIRLESPRVVVYENRAQTPYSFSHTITEGSNSVGNNDSREMITSFAAIQAANRFLRKHITPEQSALLDYQIPLRVNYQNNSQCRAFFSRRPATDIPLNPPHGSINFELPNTSCRSKALLVDVVMHEYGHALDHLTAGGIVDGAFSEGISDVLSAYVLDRSASGYGVSVTRPGPVRQLDNDKRYPQDYDASVPHTSSMIISGAFWHMRANLIGMHGKDKGAFLAEKLFLEHLLVNDQMLDSYETLLVLDDDDGDLTTPSQNFCAINEAFARHGLTNDPGCAIPFGAESAVTNFNFNLVETIDGKTTLKIWSTLPALKLLVCEKIAGQECKDRNAKLRLYRKGVVDDLAYFETDVPDTMLRDAKELEVLIQNERQTTLERARLRVVPK